MEPMSKAPPATTKEELRLQVILTPELRDKLDELRRRDPKLPTRSDLIRRLIEREFAKK